MMISFDINYFLMFQEPAIETALRATPTALPNHFPSVKYREREKTTSNRLDKIDNRNLPRQNRPTTRYLWRAPPPRQFTAIHGMLPSHPPPRVK
jgi:hypothetical protein